MKILNFKSDVFINNRLIVKVKEINPNKFRAHLITMESLHQKFRNSSLDGTRLHIIITD